jgi:hypothetical protein
VKSVPEESGLNKVSPIKENNTANAEAAVVSGAIAKAVEVASFLTDNPANQRLAVILGVRARVRDTNQVRLPVCLDPGLTGDPATTIAVAKGLANTEDAYSETSAPVLNLLVKGGWALFALKDRIAMQQAKRFGYRRSLPGMSRLPDEEGVPAFIYGETHIVTVGDLSDEIDASMITIPCEQAGQNCKQLEEISAAVNELNRCLAVLGTKVLVGRAINPGDLPAPRVPNMYLFRGFLFVAAIARWLDAHYSQGGFLTAVQQYWAQVVSQASTRVSPKVMDAIVAQYTLAHLAVHVPDYNGGWKEESIVETICKSDTAFFGTYTETTYGKFLGKYGLGVVGRHGFPEGSILQYRSYVRFPRADIAKLERMASELREGMPIKE